MRLRDLRESTAARPIVEATRRVNKDKKREALFDKAKASSKVPSFEEVWEKIETSDSVTNRYEALREDQSIKDQYEEETGETIALDDDTEFMEWILENYVRQEAKKMYQDALSNANSSDGDDCWRAMYLPKKVDPAKHDGLGVFWSLDPSGADAYYGKESASTRLVIYRARVNGDAVDKYNTVMARCHMGHGENEDEVTFIKNGKVFVYEVRYDGEDGKQVTAEIKDWRRV